MSNFIISLGIINKKLLIPIIYIIIYFFVHFINQNAEYNEVYVFLDGFGYSLGELSSFFVALFLKYRRIGYKKKKKTLLRQYFKDYFILLLILLFYMIMKLLPFYLFPFSSLSDEENEDKNKYKDLLLNDYEKCETCLHAASQIIMSANRYESRCNIQFRLGIFIHKFFRTLYQQRI